MRVDVEARRVRELHGRRSRRSRRSRRRTAPQVATALTTPGVEGRRRSRAKLARHRRAGAPERRRRRRTSTRPGRCATENEHLIEALQLRVSGVAGPRRHVPAAPPTRRRRGDAALLAAQADRLLASDVVWDDLFQAPSTRRAAERRRQRRRRARLALRHEPDLITEHVDGARPAAAPRRVDRRHADRPPRHEHRRRRRRSPGGQTLHDRRPRTRSPRRPTSPSPSRSQDSGDSQEVEIPVTLTIAEGTGGADREDEDRSTLINPGEKKTVTFGDLGQVPFAPKTTVKVDVRPVPGETQHRQQLGQLPGHLLAGPCT